MELKRLDREFTICKIKDIKDVDFTREFTFLSKTDEEISLVCESSCVPACVVEAETEWKAAKIAGKLEFGLIGVISRISGLLAAAGIGIFVISTFDTDYILLKSSDFSRGMELLEDSGYTVT